MNRTSKKLPTKPFFARFLEQQQLQAVTGGTPVPVPQATLKYPSDNDEEDEGV